MTKNKAIKSKPLDIADLLETDEDIMIFLQEMAEEGTSSEFIHALGIAARAKGMSKIARQMGVSRSSLYKSLSEEGNPGYDTVRQVIEALGYRIKLEPALAA